MYDIETNRQTLLKLNTTPSCGWSVWTKTSHAPIVQMNIWKEHFEQLLNQPETMIRPVIPAAYTELYILTQDHQLDVKLAKLFDY